MPLTDKDIFIQIRASKRERDIMKAMAKKRGLDMTGLIMKHYRNELKSCKAQATLSGVSLEQYLKMDR